MKQPRSRQPLPLSGVNRTVKPVREASLTCRLRQNPRSPDVQPGLVSA